MVNPSKNPYSKSDSISYIVCDLPPGGRDQNIRFKVFRASWKDIGILNHKIQVCEHKVPPLRGNLSGN
jgi:hypothetical protein